MKIASSLNKVFENNQNPCWHLEVVLAIIQKNSYVYSWQLVLDVTRILVSVGNS
jgi:hypothetical protein